MRPITKSPFVHGDSQIICFSSSIYAGKKVVNVCVFPSSKVFEQAWSVMVETIRSDEKIQDRDNGIQQEPPYWSCVCLENQWINEAESRLGRLHTHMYVAYGVMNRWVIQFYVPVADSDRGFSRHSFVFDYVLHACWLTEIEINVEEELNFT